MAMKEGQPRAVQLSEYRAPAYRVTDTRLRFEIGDGTTRVTSRLSIVRAPGEAPAALVLDGCELELESVAIDGRALSNNEFQTDDVQLRVHEVPERFELDIVTRIHPEQNTALEGLYKSSRMYCTQCEAEGFRKITYFPDRPDVLSRFTTTIVADGARYPTLLSNGNRVAERPLPDGRTEVTWEDPFPKPSYLFALVAGNLAVLEDQFVSASRRRVALRIYSEPHHIEQCHYAMDALKRAMRWDEQVYGREYDLDVFMIVAVEDFNMGAMENKGLNIFNTSCVLATSDTATDAAYQHVEAVVAHEYFHNWSGNRVTCRDWFQLSLKEGFTVFRDAQFSADMNSKTLFRIAQVENLRIRQFPEDAGPLAHPVRPDSYIEISNFYTATVYEKGAEVVRMIHTLLGAAQFRRGTDLYFDRHDGQAVTTEDFVRAMEDANGVDLTQFRRWYTQAGTPVLDARSTFQNGVLELVLAQSCPPTPGQPEKAAFHIPVALGLLDGAGELLGAAGVRRGLSPAIESSARTENPNDDGTLIVHVKDTETRVRVSGLEERPVVSLLRHFSAPVKVRMKSHEEDLAFLACNDSDGFSRWDAMQRLSCARLEAMGTGGSLGDVLPRLYETLLLRARTAADDGEEKALYAAMFALPAEPYLYELAAEIDVEGIHRTRRQLQGEISERLFDEWRALEAENRTRESYVPDGPGIARRSLANAALGFLAAATEPARRAAIDALLVERFQAADNLTDRLAALRAIVNSESFDDAARGRLLDGFFTRWSEEKLVIDLWFSVQAAGVLPGALARVAALERHAAFDRRNPNRARALYGAFTGNLPHLHAADGSGYRFLCEACLTLDGANPQLAARLAKPLTQWQRHQPARRQHMLDALRFAERRGKLSNDLYEVVTKGLEGQH